MHFTFTRGRRLLPALLLTSLALASCGGKGCDPRPKRKKECDKNTTTTSTSRPGGAS
jgi:predicted small lipoprotein YifL